MTKIIIADDHSIVRAGLRQILSDNITKLEIDDAIDGQDLLNKIKKKDYNLILLDISMPGRNGLEILKQLKIEKPQIPILVLSVYSEDQYALRTLKAGASGYLSKDTASDKLIEAVKKVIDGRKYISSTLAERLADSFTNSLEKSPHEYLSDREYQVFCKIASGKSVSEIASDMFLNVKTISTYRRRILNKMNMKNNSELTHYAMKNNIVD